MSDTSTPAVVSNRMILARSSFSVPQRKVLAAVIESAAPYLRNEISKAKGKELEYEVGVLDTSKIRYKARDICRPEDYGELRKALEELTDRKTTVIETEDRYIYSRLVLKAVFEPRSEEFEILIDTELFGLLFDLSTGYTTYQTRVILSFSSIYAMRIYEVLAKWRGKKNFYVSVDELRRLTDTEDKYPQTFDLKKRVLDTAKTLLDTSEITDLRFDYKERKKGRKVVGFDFYVHKTEHAHDFVNKKLQVVSLRWDFSKEMIDNFKAFGLVGLKGKNLETVKALKTLLGEKKLAAEIERIHAYAAEKTNPIGYIITSLKNALLSNQPEKTTGTHGQHEKIAGNARKNGPVAFGELFDQFKK